MRLQRARMRLSKTGNSHLRKALCFPAVSAMQWNVPVYAYNERLREKGKGKIVTLGAAMRKLLMICYGVLKNRQSFDPYWQEKSNTLWLLPLANVVSQPPSEAEARSERRL